MAKIKKIKLPDDSTARDLVDAGAVRFDEAQSLTDAQKSQARSNIGAVDATYVQGQIGGLGKAMRFIGRATTNVADGSATDPGITGYSTKQAGDVILNKDDQRELVWDGSAWEELGKEGDYVVKETGKGLSTNDYTTAEKNKLSGIAENANNYVHPGSGTNPHGTTATDIGLGNVENKSSATIRGELTKANVTTALGYTPPTTDTTYVFNTAYNASTNKAATMSDIASKTGDLSTLSTTAKGTLTAAVNELFTSVSDGKATVASAITDKGVTTASDATFATMATNIAAIETGITPTGNIQLTQQSGTDVTTKATASVRSAVTTVSASKGSVSNHSISVTPSVSVGTSGWIGSGKSGTAVTVSASELVSGNLPITSNGTGIDVTNYATVSVNVAGSSASGTKNIVSNGTYDVTDYATAAVSIPTSGTIKWYGTRSWTNSSMTTNMYLKNESWSNSNGVTGIAVGDMIAIDVLNTDKNIHYWFIIDVTSLASDGHPYGDVIAVVEKNATTLLPTVAVPDYDGTVV